MPPKMLILLLAACLVWIVVLSIAFLAMSGTAASTGFIVAGSLVGAAVAWVLVMIREIRDAIQVSDYSAHGARQEGYDVDGKSCLKRPLKL